MTNDEIEQAIYAKTRRFVDGDVTEAIRELIDAAALAREPRHLTDAEIATVWTKFDGDVEGDPRQIVAFARLVLALSAQAGAREPAQQPIDLQSIEQYRGQLSGICTAAIGYWKEGDSIHPDYDTIALRDVARLYAKYAALHDAQHKAKKPKA